ncbi:IclR family transcriptional regulator [Sphingobium sufflavum]|uniref:IclR family transcriptional regulator n=1 Tax=Sphingobium sufflavum TaxID=1129547 RepID=UPI001F1ED168|nr:IclR family transcriptional regulator [Sphingobium sufflavum]MCE7796893.1 IclR family transcriptional regulator [Sphingobium sufflavum]
MPFPGPVEPVRAMTADDRRLNSPQSVTRVIRILEALCAADGPVGLADLSRLLDTPKSSLAALLRGLTDSDVLLFADGSYRLGPGAFGLGSALMEARRRIQSSDLVREGMRRLADRSGETVLFGVRDEDGQTMTYVDAVESRNVIRFAVSAGDRRPLYCTAGGRLLLAVAGAADAARYIDHYQPRQVSSRPAVTPRRLAAIVEEVRAADLAQTVDEMEDGVTGTAAPIRDAGGAVIGALIIAAPSSRSQDRLMELATLAREEARAISRTLGHRAAQGG